MPVPHDTSRERSRTQWPSDIQRQMEQLEILKGLLGGGP